VSAEAVSHALVAIPFIAACLWVLWQIANKPGFHTCPLCHCPTKGHDDEFCKRSQRWRRGD
jgi:hypothetical protein